MWRLLIRCVATKTLPAPDASGVTETAFRVVDSDDNRCLAQVTQYRSRNQETIDTQFWVLTTAGNTNLGGQGQGQIGVLGPAPIAFAVLP